MASSTATVLRVYRLSRPPSHLLSSLTSLSNLCFLSFSFPSLPSPPLPPSRSLRLFCSSAPNPSPPLLHLSRDLEDGEEREEGGEELENDDQVKPENEPFTKGSLPSFPTPKLDVKEKKELASYAHSLGKKLKSQQVGKSGVTASVAASFIETLEANELLKIKVHGSCPGELSDVIRQLETATGSVAVGQIGRSVILYRPSLSKMKQKEVQSARIGGYTKPTTSFKMQKKGQVSKASAHGRH